MKTRERLRDELIKQIEDYRSRLANEVVPHFENNQLERGNEALRHWRMQFLAMLRRYLPSEAANFSQTIRSQVSYGIMRKIDRPPLIKLYSKQVALPVHNRIDELLNQLQQGRLDEYIQLDIKDKKLSDDVESPRKTLRCFLAHRFSKGGQKYGSQVEKFLGLLGIDVLTGEGYEPRGVGEKVDNLLQDIDFLILIVAEDGESFWTRDEIATVKAKGKHVIPLIVEGANFAPGIFGDLETIPFSSGHVGDTFISILEGISYIREQ